MPPLRQSDIPLPFVVRCRLARVLFWLPILSGFYYRWIARMRIRSTRGYVMDVVRSRKPSESWNRYGSVATSISDIMAEVTGVHCKAFDPDDQVEVILGCHDTATAWIACIQALENAFGRRPPCDGISLFYCTLGDLAEFYSRPSEVRAEQPLRCTVLERLRPPPGEWLNGQMKRLHTVWLDMEGQLLLRPHFAADAWDSCGVDVTLAESVCQLLCETFDWPNNHFLPDDPLEWACIDGENMGLLWLSMDLRQKYGCSLPLAVRGPKLTDWTVRSLVCYVEECRSGCNGPATSVK